VINSFILIVASAAFAQNYGDTEDIFQAYGSLTLALGTKTASTMFAVALLASGQQASLTGTLAGQIVMEGMLNWGVKPWKRQFVTRFIAMVPTIVVTVVLGEKSIVLLICEPSHHFHDAVLCDLSLIVFYEPRTDHGQSIGELLVYHDRGHGGGVGHCRVQTFTC
jgi:manganese transport protein